MSAIETLREMSEVWSLFSDMPDDATIGVDLAALYLGVSVKTLARYRQNGDGPPYVQYQSSDSKARNQRVNYLLSDLRTWRNGHRVNSTMQAAQVRGLAFTSLNDLAKPQPFWVDTHEEKIIGHALVLTDSIFKECLKNLNCEVIWLNIEEVLSKQWNQANERRVWHDLLLETIKETLIKTIAQQEKHDILKSLNDDK
ncbi:hypothetical protein IAE30_25355 [Pantoea sp. S61]|uniref:hypothetical protein n=1 Tax=Pantoea sp. S61 TaxID=2767442 RepID=UPI00190CA680|nr:hypothetical protein [Pantoea sp. S61]MBK0127074.1 hypothetical protein [Pantoea sp. S61]